MENKLTADTEDVELQCSEICPCRTLQNRARADRWRHPCPHHLFKVILIRYIFSLASNPFYLWLICTIFYEAGEGYVPRTLTQLYTWVMLVFSNQWQHTEDKLSLDTETITFLKGCRRRGRGGCGIKGGLGQQVDQVPASPACL